MDMTTSKAELQQEPRDKLRDRAKVVTKMKQDNYVDGRLGLVIDGTGADYDKIVRQSIGLKQLGYDTHMIYVNTSLDVALDRNSKRERKVSTSIATKLWKDVQSNLGKFSQHFRRNMIVVDNNEVLEDDGTLFNDVLRQIKPLLKRKVTSPSANAWIEMEMKRRGITRKPKGF